MSYGYGMRKVPHLCCEVCGEELNNGEDVYEADDGGYVCEDCIEDYLYDWKKEHKVWLRDATDYSMVDDRED